MLSFSNSKEIDISMVRDFYCNYATWKVPSRIEDWSKMIINSSVILSAWEDKKLIGMIRALSDGVRWATLLDVLIHPDYQKNGLGTELLTRLMAEELMHVRTIFIGTPDACKFYEKNGFEYANDKGAWMIKVQKEFEMNYK